MDHGPELICIIVAIFMVGGWVKGVVGMGLPTVAMGALALFMQPVQAAALMVVPSLVTNLWQFLAGPSKWATVRRFAFMMVCVCIGTSLGIQLLTAGDSNWPSIALGTILSAYALFALYLRKLALSGKHESLLSPVMGVATGVLSGASGISVVPAVPYLSALNLPKDDLVQAMGLSFTVCTLALAVALRASGNYQADAMFGSLAAVVPALLGMWIGQRTRDRIDAVAFRRWFFIALLLIGLFMVAKGLGTS